MGVEDDSSSDETAAGQAAVEQTTVLPRINLRERVRAWSAEKGEGNDTVQGLGAVFPLEFSRGEVLDLLGVFLVILLIDATCVLFIVWLDSVINS